MGRASTLTTDERAEVVLRLLRREEPASVLSKRYQISEATLSRWKDEFLAGGKAGLGGSKKAQKRDAERLKQLEDDLAERNRVIGELTIANRFLKKTADPFSTPNGGKH